jgi:hypothetical protein
VVIHLASPVGTAKDMDVFVMLFRHLTITIKSRLLEKGRQAASDVESIGREAVRTLNLRLMAVAYGLLLVLVGIFVAYMFPLHQHQQVLDLTTRYERLNDNSVEADYAYRAAKQTADTKHEVVEGAGKKVNGSAVAADKAAQQHLAEVERAVATRRAVELARAKDAIADKKAETFFNNEYFPVGAAPRGNISADRLL